MILSKIGTLHKLEYLFLWKYFKKQVAFCRKRFLCCATVSICCAVFTANRTTIRLYFSRLYPHVGGGIHPSRVVRPYCCTTQKAGANISFAPAVLLLRSHSLITLFVIFRTVSASSWESSYLFANFDCPFRILLTVHWTYPLVRYLLKSICGTE